MEKTKFKLTHAEARELQEIVYSYIVDKTKGRLTIIDAYILDSLETIKHKVDKAVLKLNYSENKTVTISIAYLDFITISIIATYLEKNEAKNNTGIINKIISELPIQVIYIMEHTKNITQKD